MGKWHQEKGEEGLAGVSEFVRRPGGEGRKRGVRKKKGLQGALRGKKTELEE